MLLEPLRRDCSCELCQEILWLIDRFQEVHPLDRANIPDQFQETLQVLFGPNAAIHTCILGDDRGGIPDEVQVILADHLPESRLPLEHPL